MQIGGGTEVQTAVENVQRRRLPWKQEPLFSNPAPEKLQTWNQNGKGAEISWSITRLSNSSCTSQPHSHPFASTPTCTKGLRAGAFSPRLKSKTLSLNKLDNMPGKNRAPIQDVDATELVASYLISQERGRLDYMLPAHTLQLTRAHSPTYCIITVSLSI